MILLIDLFCDFEISNKTEDCLIHQEALKLQDKYHQSLSIFSAVITMEDNI